ncbi:MAG TPA: ABC transporter ATP-binding protein [Candidatus Bathyarchaeia archaeon]|nr:ABC transporter ATP-binding protein [Candidatus Bathyarchaeia archaeon]
MIRLHEVSFAFPDSGRRELLRGITLTIGDGEWVAVTGGNGSGKTTLCRLMAGIYNPSSGRVTVDGADPARSSGDPPRAPAVGIAFQNPDSQFVTSSVEREILFGMENVGTAESEMRSRLAAAARLFAVERYLPRNPHTLSGGEKQRLLLASLWGMAPRHLILDEPCSFLDRPAREAFLEAVRGSFRREGKTIVWSTVDAREAMLADRVIYLSAGEVRFDGAPGDLARSIPAGELEASLVYHDAERGTDDEGRRRAERVRGGVPVCAGRSSAAAVDITRARFSPGGDFVLDVPALTIASGERLGVCGASGSGKTTLLLGCAGLLPARDGEVVLFGAPVRSRRDFPAGRVGFLFQSPEEGFFAPTVREEIALACRFLDRGRSEGDAVSRSLAEAGLAPEKFLDRSPFHLSQGEKRLVALASILVLEASLYFLDEPTIFLDGGARRRLGAALERLCERGATVVVASHDETFLRECTDRTVILEDGRLA